MSNIPLAAVHYVSLAISLCVIMLIYFSPKQINLLIDNMVAHTLVNDQTPIQCNNDTSHGYIDALVALVHSQISYRYDTSTNQSVHEALVRHTMQLDPLFNCSSQVVVDWSNRLHSNQCKNRIVMNNNRNLLFTQVYHSHTTANELYNSSVGMANHGGVPDGRAACDIDTSKLLPSLYSSAFSEQLAEGSSVVALMASAHCMLKPTDYVSTQTWKPNKLIPPCNHLRELNQSIWNDVNTMSWNRVSGDGVIHAHPGLAAFDNSFWSNMFDVSSPVDPHQWLWEEPTFTVCCNAFSIRVSNAHYVAKLHTLALWYVAAHYGSPLHCPFGGCGDPDTMVHCNRCWGYWMERITMVYLKYISPFNADVTDSVNHCQNLSYVGIHNGAEKRLLTLKSDAAKVTEHIIDLVYQRLRCGLDKIHL